MKSDCSVRRTVVRPAFADILARESTVGLAGGVDPLARLAYPAELSAKQSALARFWHAHRLPGTPGTIEPSPRPRNYRTTTRRRVHGSAGAIRFEFDERTGDRTPGVAESVLEPNEHAAIYRRLHERVASPPYRHLARHLNHVIIRGTYGEFVVILNVDCLDSAIVRKVKLLADHLQSAALGVTAAFIYHDPLRSRYYFEQFSPDMLIRSKKIFGRDMLMAAVAGRRYIYDPTVFSQVNESILPAFCETVAGMLGGEGGRLVDLYCGYGLFSHYLADRFGEVLGLDANVCAIDSAERSIRLNPGRARRRFHACDITTESLPSAWRQMTNVRESVILDPPRQGTAPGVIGIVAGRHPARVVHIFCEVDEIPRAMDEWQRGGYAPDRIAPLDMFPGTPNLEVVISL